MCDYNLIKSDAKKVVSELLDAVDLKEKDIVIVGCSTSEVMGKRIGKGSDVNVAEYLMSAILPLLKERNLFLGIQCCEHLNRGVVVEAECAEKYDLDIVSVIPHAKAGGAMGQEAMKTFDDPVVVESIKAKAKAGIDIGDTLIGMHLKRVAVPLRLSVKKIGEAHVTSAYTRPPLIGGERAKYKKD